MVFDMEEQFMLLIFLNFIYKETDMESLPLDEALKIIEKFMQKSGNYI